MPENLMNSAHKSTTDAYRRGWDMIFAGDCLCSDEECCCDESSDTKGCTCDKKDGTCDKKAVTKDEDSV